MRCKEAEVMAWHLCDYLEASATRHPDQVAVVDPSHGTLTYGELNTQADALARFLHASGVKRGDRVGVVLPKSLSAVVSLFGIMKAGAAYVPADYSAPPRRTRKILSDCRIKALIVDSRCLEVIPPAEAPDLALCAVIVVGGAPPSTTNERWAPFAAALNAEGGASPDVGRSSSDLAYILYTSGSTGMPKGAAITHGNALSFIEWASLAFTPTENDRISNHAPFHFDYSVFDIYLTMKHAATLYLITEDLGRNPKELARFIANNKLTVWGSTPSALMMLVQFGNLEAHDASSLRLVTFGGEVFPPRQLRELRRLWPSPEFFNLYGPTEITTACTFARIPRTIPANRQNPYPIGFACAHCRALALDENHQQVAPGEEGLLHISGPSVFLGYWNRPAETAAVMVNRDGGRWYNTGDVVRWDPAEGFTYVGRRDRMVKRRGFRIELGEIESALYLHTRLLEAAVVSVSDAEAGVKIVAFVCCPEGEPPSLVELKTFCGARLPAYMIPDQFVFQRRLPRTSSDKVDYQALKGQLQVSCVG
jgi:amino acid adenylation domain-containing protein